MNRNNSNSGTKTFVTTLLNQSDKGLSLHQKQNIFGDSFSQLSQLTTLNIGGRERDLLVFMTGDWEAGAERFGGQGASAVNPSFVCNIKSEDLGKHGEKGPHNHKTVECEIRSYESISEHYSQQIRDDAILEFHM